MTKKEEHEPGNLGYCKKCGHSIWNREPCPNTMKAPQQQPDEFKSKLIQDSFDEQVHPKQLKQNNFISTPQEQPEEECEHKNKTATRCDEDCRCNLLHILCDDCNEITATIPADFQTFPSSPTPQQPENGRTEDSDKCCLENCDSKKLPPNDFCQFHCDNLPF